MIKYKTKIVISYFIKKRSRGRGRGRHNSHVQNQKSLLYQFFSVSFNPFATPGYNFQAIPSASPKLLNFN